MRKLISFMLTLTLFCSVGISSLAAEAETVDEKITLTQFIETDRDKATSVQLYFNGQNYVVDKDEFYNIADSMMITQNAKPYTIANDGIYICVSTSEDVGSMLYLCADGIDRATPAAGRPLNALYTVDDVTLVEKIAALAEQPDNIQYSGWAAVEIAKANELKIIPDDFSATDYTQPVTRENFCILAAKMIDTALNKELSTANPQYPLEIVDTDNVNIDKLYASGIIKGKEQNETGVIFAPDDLITREEAATLLHRIAVYIEIDIPPYMNVVHYWDEDKVSDWAIDSVKTLREMNIMNGASGYEFYPKDTYTIEQAIATMVRLYKCKAGIINE